MDVLTGKPYREITAFPACGFQTSRTAGRVPESVVALFGPILWRSDFDVCLPANITKIRPLSWKGRNLAIRISWGWIVDMIRGVLMPETHAPRQNHLLAALSRMNTNRSGIGFVVPVQKGQSLQIAHRFLSGPWLSARMARPAPTQ